MSQTKVQLLRPDLGDVIDFDSSTLFMDGADNRVGIRNTNPQYELDVTGTVRATNFIGAGTTTIADWIVHDGDTNTKFGFPAADQFQVQTGGSARLTVTDSTTTLANNAVFNGNSNVLAGNYLDIQNNKKLRLGTNGDCAFYFNGSATLIETGNKIIHIQTDASIRLQKNDPQAHMLIANAGGSVDLYHNGTLKLATDADGIRIGSGGGDNTIVDLHNASYDNGVIQYYNGSVNIKTGSSNGDRQIALATAGSTRLLITNAGNVGIGNRTSSPDADLHVHTSSGESTIHVEGATHGILNLRSHSGDSTIKFSDAAATNVGNINYDHATDSLAFRVNSDARLTILSDGKLMTQHTGTIITASSAGSLTLAGGNTNLGGKILLTGGNGTGDIIFYAQTGTATPAERLKIAADGVLYHKPSGNTTDAYLKSENTSSTYILKAQKDGTADTNLSFNVQDGGSLATLLYLRGDNKTVAVGPNITPIRNLHVQEHFLVANRGTNGGQPYVSSTPILAVTTDGSNVVPGDTTYRYNALVSFGVGGHNGGNPGSNACPGLGYFKLDLYGQTGLGDVGTNLDSTLSIRSINPNNTRLRIRTKDNYNGSYPHASISFTQQQSTEIGRIECLSQTGVANRAHLDFHTNYGALARRMRIMDTGKILYGNHLHDRGAQFQYEGSEHAGIGIHRNTADHGAPAMTFSASRGTSAGANTLVQSGDYLGLIRFAGTDGSADLASGAQITGIVDGTAAANDMPTRLGFWVSPDNSDSPVERLQIRSRGDLSVLANNKGWSTMQLGNIRYHCRQHYSNGNFVVTTSLMRIKRFWWGWGTFKITAKMNYYGAGSHEATFFMNGHGVNDSYSIVQLKEELTNGNNNYYGGSGLISVTSPSSNSPGTGSCSFVDVQINIPNYTYAIIIMECMSSQHGTDPTNMGNNEYVLL